MKASLKKAEIKQTDEINDEGLDKDNVYTQINFLVDQVKCKDDMIQEQAKQLNEMKAQLKM